MKRKIDVDDTIGVVSKKIKKSRETHTSISSSMGEELQELKHIRTKAVTTQVMVEPVNEDVEMPSPEEVVTNIDEANKQNEIQEIDTNATDKLPLRVNILENSIETTADHQDEPEERPKVAETDEIKQEFHES